MSSCCAVEYGQRFVIEAAPQVVWAALEDFSSWGNSSTWVRHLEVHGQGLNDGTVLCATIATPLAHPMHLEVELDRCIPVELIVAKVSGDFRGEGRLQLQGDDRGTQAQVAWTLEMMPLSLRALARVAGPLLRWGHDVIVESMLEALKARVYRLSTSTGSGNLEQGEQWSGPRL